MRWPRKTRAPFPSPGPSRTAPTTSGVGGAIVAAPAESSAPVFDMLSIPQSAFGHHHRCIGPPWPLPSLPLPSPTSWFCPPPFTTPRPLTPLTPAPAPTNHTCPDPPGEALDSFSAGGRSLSTSLGELQTALHLDPAQPSTADLAAEFARVRHDLRDLRSKLSMLRAFREEALALAQTVRALERSGGEVGTSTGGAGVAASPRSSSGGSSHTAVGGAGVDALVGPIQAAVRQAVKEALERQGIPLATLSAVRAGDGGCGVRGVE